MTRLKTRLILLALMTVVGVAPAVASLVTPWFRSTLRIFEGRGSYDTQKSEVLLSDVGDWWGLVYQVAVPVLVVLLVVALIGPVRARVLASTAALVAAVVVAASLVGGWIDVMDARQTFTDLAEELQAAAPNAGYVLWSVGQTGLVLATIAWVAFVLIASAAVWAALAGRSSRAVLATDRGQSGQPTPPASRPLPVRSPSE